MYIRETIAVIERLELASSEKESIYEATCGGCAVWTRRGGCRA